MGSKTEKDVCVQSWVGFFGNIYYQEYDQFLFHSSWATFRHIFDIFGAVQKPYYWAWLLGEGGLRLPHLESKGFWTAPCKHNIHIFF